MKRAQYLVFFLTSVSILALQTSAPAQETWTGTASGVWSNSANWLSGIAPPAGGSATQALTLQNNGAFAWTATNDLGAPFTLNGLTLASFSSGLGTIAGTALAFDGTNPFVTNTATGNWTISNPLTLNADLTLGGTGPGNTTFTGLISGPGAIIVGGPTASHNLTNIYTIGGGTVANTYAGGTVLNSGHLILANTSGSVAGNSPLGSGPVTVNGGRFGTQAGSGFVPNNFILNSTLNISAPGFQYFTGSLSGPGGVNIRNQGNATQSPAMVEFRNANSFSGPIVVQQTTLHTAGLFGNGTLSAPRLLVNQNGSIFNASAIEVQGGGSLTLDNATAAIQRASGTTPLSLKSADFVLIGNATTAIDQPIGAITGSGHSGLAITPAAAAAQITAASLGRTLRGAFVFRSANIGNPVGPGVGNFFFTTPPAMVGGGGADGTTIMSIIPFAGGSTGNTNASDLVTYGATGVRMLTSSEYAPALGGNTQDNVRLAHNTDNNDPQTVNSLSTEGNLTGTGTINVTSGMWMSRPTTAANATNQVISNNVNFGSAEGHILTGSFPPAGPGTLTVDGILTAPNGLTKSGFGTLTLNNIANAISGTITLNAGVINFSTPDVLGGSNQIVVTYLGSSFPSFTYTGSDQAILPQNVITNSGHFRMTASASGASLVFNGDISGPGGLQLNASGAGASITLAGNNTFEQGVRIFNGDTVFDSDVRLGDPAAGLDVGTGAANEGIKLTGNWTSNRNMHVSGVAGINTQAHNAALSGTISGSSALTKIGTGTLSLNGQNTYTGTLNVNEGKIAINGTTIAPVVVSGGTLGGTGRVGAVTMNFNSKVAPGSSAGVLRATSLLWNDGQMEFELKNVGTQQDMLEIIAAFTKGTGSSYQFNIIPLPGFQSGTYTLVTFGANSGFSQTDFIYTAPSGLTGNFVLHPNRLDFVATFDGLGDATCNNGVNIDDLPAFINRLVDPESYVVVYPGCTDIHTDINGDGNVDGLDIQGFADIMIP